MYRCLYSVIALIFAITTVAIPPTALAEDADTTEYVEIDEASLDGDGRDDGLYAGLDVEGSFNLVSNRNVVGENDGMSLHIGAGSSANLDWIRGDHVLRNTLEIDSSWARTPALETFVKNSDNVDLESLYNFYLTDWAGPFARASLETSAFPTHARTAEETDYAIERLDGTVDEQTTDRLRVADPFQPMSLFQSVGAALEPVSDERIRTSFRLGFGARQTLAEGVLVVTDDTTDDDQVIVDELDNAIQAGAEAFAGVEGQFSERNLSYRLGATGLVPFINNDDTERSALELTRIGVTATARVDVFSWMGLTYRASLLNDPQLVDELQVQNSLLLTLNYTLIDSGE